MRERFTMSVSQWPKWLRRQYGKLEICGSSPCYDTNFSLKIIKYIYIYICIYIYIYICVCVRVRVHACVCVDQRFGQQWIGQGGPIACPAHSPVFDLARLLPVGSHEILDLRDHCDIRGIASRAGCGCGGCWRSKDW